MTDIPMKVSAPLTRQTVTSINHRKVQGPRSSRDILSINNGIPSGSHTSVQPQPGTRLPSKPVPPLLHTVKKGQKVPLSASGQIAKIKACLGWNIKNAACDVDVSAFMLNANGKVIGDTWFVFYGQTESPDKSTRFRAEEGIDRESITIDLSKIDPSVSKIVFVLTINEAKEKNLNFSMLKDAYIRILDAADDRECVSFQMDEYYANVTSMMIGEVYLYHGTWKFNAIGNGVARDLAGLCELYGVQVI